MRRKNNGRFKSIVLTVVTMLLLVAIGTVVLRRYNAKIEKQLFDASSASIEDTYAEAVMVFDELTTSRWNYLKQVALYMEESDGKDESTIVQHFQKLKQAYGFTEFYLLDESGAYMTMSGSTGYIDLGEAIFDLVDDGENIVTDGSLPGRENMFFYAVPSKTGVYQDFTYCAVAFGYDKQDMTSVMDLTAYNGASDTYLVYSNGRVCITMGQVRFEIRNVLNTLEDEGLDEKDLAQVKDDLQEGRTDTLTVNLGGENYYLTYTSTRFSEWRLVGLTPVGTVDRSINQVRSTTTSMMLGLGIVMFVMMASMVFYWSWRNIRDKSSLLAEREMIFNVLSEHMDEIYLLYNDEIGRVQYVSPNVERLIGISPKLLYEEVGVMSACVVEQDAWNNHSALAALTPGEMLHREYHIKNRNTQEIHPFLLDIYRSDHKGHEHTLIMSLTDNTREEAIRAEIMAAMESARAANAAKSSFLSSMSHDIRTPMNAIVGFTTLLDRDANDSERVHYYTDRIRSSGNHLLSLISDVLDISKIESGNVTLQPEEVDLQELITQMVDMIQNQVDARKQTLSVHVDLPSSEPVIADPMRLRQILQNILSNAVKYTQEGGLIELTVLQDKDKDKDKDKDTFSNYRFIVHDNGIGMSEAYLEKIFLPFTREVNSTINKVQGTGLGMSITKSLVEMMGGTIQVESKQGEGSTFTVNLSLRSASQMEEGSEGIIAGTETAAAGAGKDSVQSLSKTGVDLTESQTANAEGAVTSQQVEEDCIEGLHILAAEDNELNAEILEELLKMEGATCTIVHNGQEAMETFEAAAPGQYDLILMDVQMPVMNGYEATRAIRASKVNPEGASILIIAMTANAFNEDVQNALDAGMDAHLAKPMNMIALRHTVCKLQRKKVEE